MAAAGWVVIRYVHSPIGARYQLGVNDAPHDRVGRRGRGWVVISKPATKAAARRLASTMNTTEAARAVRLGKVTLEPCLCGEPKLPGVSCPDPHCVTRARRPA